MEPVDEPGEAQAEPPQPPSQDAPPAEELTDAVEPEEEPDQAQAEAAPRDTSAQPTVPPPLQDAPLAGEPAGAREPEEEPERAQSQPRDASPVPGPAQPTALPPPQSAPAGEHPNRLLLSRALAIFRSAMASFIVEELVFVADAIPEALAEPSRGEYLQRLKELYRPANALRPRNFPRLVEFYWNTHFAKHFGGDHAVVDRMEQVAEAADRAEEPGTDDLAADYVGQVLTQVSALLHQIGESDRADDVSRLAAPLLGRPPAQDRLEREQAPAGPRAATPQPEPARSVAERADAARSALPQAAPELPDAAGPQPAAITPKRVGVGLVLITVLTVAGDLAGLPWGKIFRVVALMESSISFVVILYEWRVLGVPVLVVLFLALMLAVWLVVWTAYRLGWLRRGATVAPGVARSIRRALGIVLAAARAAGNRARRVASTAARASRDSAWLRGITSLAPRAAGSLVRVLAMGVAAARGAGGSAAPAPVSAQIEEAGTDAHAARAQTPPVQAETELLGRAGAPPVEVQIRQGSALPDYSYPNYDALSTGSKIYTDAMRRLIRDRLSGSSPDDWWDTLVLRRLEGGQRSSIEQKTREHHEKDLIDLVDAPHFLSLVMRNYELFRDVFGTGSRNERLTRQRLWEAGDARNEGPGHSPTGDLKEGFVQHRLLGMKELLERFDRPAADRIDELFGSLTREAAPEAAQPMRERGVHVPVRGPGLLSGALKRAGGSLVSIRPGVALLAVALLLVVGAGAWFIVSPGGSEAPASPAERAEAAPSSPTAAAAPTPTPTARPTAAATAVATAAATPAATAAATPAATAAPTSPAIAAPPTPTAAAVPELWTIKMSVVGVAHRDSCHESARRSGKVVKASVTGQIWYDGTPVLHAPIAAQANCGDKDPPWYRVTGWARLRTELGWERSRETSWVSMEWLEEASPSPAVYAEALLSAGCVPSGFSLVVPVDQDNAWLEVRCSKSDEWEVGAFERAVARAVTKIGCSESELQPDDDEVVVWCDTGPNLGL